MAGNVGKRGDSWSYVGVMEKSGSTFSRKPSWVSRDCSRESETRRSGVEWSGVGDTEVDAEWTAGTSILGVQVINPSILVSPSHSFLLSRYCPPNPR